MFKKLKRWWKVRKLNRSLLRQAELDRDLPPYGYERVSDWIQSNEFGLTQKNLSTHCVSRVEKNRAQNITRNLTWQ